MSYKNGLTRCRHRVEDARSSVSRGRYELAASGVEPDIENLVVMTTKRLDALAGRHIPDFALPIDRTTNANRALVVELSAGNFSVVASEGVNAATSPHVPDFDSVIKRTCNNGSPSRVEVETYNLSGMALQYSMVG